MSNVLDSVYAEPLTDTIPKRSIFTAPYLLKEFDISKLTIEDLNLHENFEIKARFDNSLDALVVYFDIMFSKGNEILSISTSPYYKETRWKQTIFYIKDNLYCRKDESIQGKFSCIRKTDKELNITVNIEFNGELSKLKSTHYYRMI